MNMRIELSYKATKRMLKSVGGRDIPDARRAALNRAATAGRTAGLRVAAPAAGMTQKSIRRKFKIAKSKGREGWKASSAAVYFNKVWRGNAGLLDVNEVGRGISVAGGPVADGAFGYFRRSKTYIYKRVGRDRYPITQAKFEIGDVLDGAVRAAVRFRANQVFKERFPHELDYRLKKRAGVI